MGRKRRRARRRWRSMGKLGAGDFGGFGGFGWSWGGGEEGFEGLEFGAFDGVEGGVFLARFEGFLERRKRGGEAEFFDGEDGGASEGGFHFVVGVEWFTEDIGEALEGSGGALDAAADDKFGGG